MTLAPAELGRGSARRFGRAGAALLLAAAGIAAALLVGLVLGVVSRALEGSIDRPFHVWSQQVPESGLVHRQMLKIAVLADVPMTQVLAMIAAVVLAYAYRSRAWIPLVLISSAYVVERVVQTLLATWIDRGHPVGTTGTFPSGGVLRVLVVYGAVIACVLVLLPTLERTTRRMVWAGLAVVTVGVAISRLWLGKHWLTDVVAAFPLGVLMLAFEVAILAALTGTGSRPWAKDSA